MAAVFVQGQSHPYHPKSRFPTSVHGFPDPDSNISSEFWGQRHQGTTSRATFEVIRTECPMTRIYILNRCEGPPVETTSSSRLLVLTSRPPLPPAWPPWGNHRRTSVIRAYETTSWICNITAVSRVFRSLTALDRLPRESTESRRQENAAQRIFDS